MKRTPPDEEETIAAIATPFGESGIGIVRISGSLAEPIAKKLFKPKKDQSYFISHHFHYGEIIDPQNGNPVDEVLIVLMKSPKTYTRRCCGDPLPWRVLHLTEGIGVGVEARGQDGPARGIYEEGLSEWSN